VSPDGGIRGLLSPVSELDRSAAIGAVVAGVGIGAVLAVVFGIVAIVWLLRYGVRAPNASTFAVLALGFTTISWGIWRRKMFAALAGIVGGTAIVAFECFRHDWALAALTMSIVVGAFWTALRGILRLRNQSTTH